MARRGRQAKEPENVPSEPATGSTDEERVLQARREFNAALERTRTRGRARAADGRSTLAGTALDHDDPAALDTMATELRRRMEAAASADQDSIDAGRAALEKHRMLPEVLQMLARRNMHEIMLDAGILGAVRMWLEPLPDRTLPAAPLRRALLDAMRDMPVDTDHLRESGIGRIVLYYARRERELPEIQRLAKELLFHWSQPILAATHGARSVEEGESGAPKDDDSRVLQSSAYQRMQGRSPTKASPAAARMLAKRVRR